MTFLQNSWAGFRKSTATLPQTPLRQPQATNSAKYIVTEFAKLRTFRAHMPYVPTCLRALNYHVPTCLRALNYYVPTCPHFSRAYVLTCLYIFFVPTCLRDLNYFVPTFAHFSRTYVPTINHKLY